MKITMPSRANHSQITVGFGIALYLPEPPILDGRKYATAVAAPIAKSRDLCDGCLRACMGPLLKIEKFMSQRKGSYGRSGRFEKSPPR